MRKKKKKNRPNKGVNVIRNRVIILLVILIILLVFFGKLLILGGVNEDIILKDGELGNYGKSELQTQKIYLFPNQVKTFETNVLGYKNISWYLDGEIVSKDSNYYDFDNTQGEYLLVVNIWIEGNLGNNLISEAWEIYVDDQEYVEVPYIDREVVIYIVLVIVLIFIMFLVVYLFVIEKNSKDVIE